VYTVIAEAIQEINIFAVTSFILYTKKNYVTLVCEQTIPTEQPPLVGEVSANFCG
jgi:non-homologous end joining protein Ku